MLLLALDTAGDGCSAGVFAAGRPVSMRRHVGPSGHAEQLPLMLRDVLGEAEVALSGLDALAVTVGPGSFTGIRTGLAAARGLALATSLPIFAITTFEALVAALSAEAADFRPIVAVVDARRGQVYLQLFHGDRRPASPPRAASPEAAARGLDGALRLTGSGARLLRPFLRDPAGHEIVEVGLDAAAVALAAEAASARGVAPVAGPAAVPLYLRDADARADAGRALLTAEG